MITAVKLTGKDSENKVVISLEQMTHMIRTTDNFGNEYTEIHFTGGNSIDVKETIKECEHAITKGLYEINDED